MIIEPNRLTHAALLMLLESTKCLRWLGGSEADTKLGEALHTDRPGTKLSTFPPLDYFLADGDDVPEYPFNHTWEEAQSHPVFVIHSSGTTGMPKPLRWGLGICGTFNILRRFPDGTLENPDSMYTPLLDSRVLWASPPKWGAGIIGYLLLPLFWDIVPIWPPVDEVVPTPAPVVAEVFEKTRPDGAFYVPSTLRNLCLDARSLELVKQHKFIGFGGAPLDEWVGDMLCTEIQLLPMMGATECGIMPMLRPDDRREWRYYHFDPHLGPRLEHHYGDTYELVFDRDPALYRYQGAFHMYPDQDVYHTQDLYTRHPTKPDLVLYYGRKDDLIKLVWLTKVRATDMETALCASPDIAEAMVGGEGRPTPFVILQPNKTVEDKISPDELWPIVKGVNDTLSAEVHIPRENIIVTDPGRPLKTMSKGTLDRKGILSDYSDEITLLYPVEAA